MKKIVIIAAVLGLGAAVSSCELDKYPETGYNEHNAPNEDGGTDTAIKTREQLAGQLTAMYDYMRGDYQGAWYQLICLADARVDNAYGGNLGEAKVVAVEANQIDSENEFASTLWNYPMTAIDRANQIICNIDAVKENDPTLTEREYQEWLSEALCWRAYNWLLMHQIYGDVPMLREIPPAITSDNIEEVYPLYFPPRETVETLQEQIVKDLEYACQYAPDVDAANKYKITKGFANGLAAKFYAMRAFRDWTKVKSYCEAVEGLGYELCDNYEDLWAYTPGDGGMAAQNTKESIFEVSWPNQSNGSWIWMMFYRNAYKPDDSFSWAKWCTPSRNLIAAFEKEGDTERMNASVKYDACGWSFHYPKDNYAFMYKCRTNVSPVYVMRLADILLLHAEALANLNDAGGAADLVDEVRGRVHLPKLTSAQRGSAEQMKEAVLHERRLELAFEGHRWFDLVRFDEDNARVKAVSDNANVPGTDSYDSYTQVRRPMDDNRILLPVPTSVIENNPNIHQNTGY